ncbi:hypothetical protein D9M71_649990 [compost metagenome]
MSEVIRSEIRKAIKDHSCNACYWFERSNFGENDLLAEDWTTVQQSRKDGGRIVSGTKYIYQVHRDCGEIVEVKVRQDMHAICLKYDLYPED